jgi:hypothetical protein
MRWKVYIELNCSQDCTEEQIESICDRLHNHHCVLSAKPDIVSGVQTKDENNSSNDEVNKNDTKLIICHAAVIHKDDEESLKGFIGKIKNISIKEFLPESTPSKVYRVLNISKFTAIVVFIIVFSHEAILIVTKEKEILEPWTFAIVITVIASLAVLGVDAAMIWKEHHN